MARVPAVAANWRENLAHVVAAFPVPAGEMPVACRSPPAVTVGGRPLRDVSGRLTLGDGRLGLADLRVMMPGDTLVTGDATVRGVGDSRRVEGTNSRSSVAAYAMLLLGWAWRRSDRRSPARRIYPR